MLYLIIDDCMYLDLKLNILYPTVFNEIFISYITFYISDKKTNNDLENILSLFA